MDPGPEKLRLRIFGQPKGAGSKTAEPLGKRGHEARDREGRLILKYRHATKGTAEWMEGVAREAAVAWARTDPLDGGLWVLVDCFEARPDGHFLADGRLRPSAPARPHSTITHDSGKLRRAIEDALTNAKVWADDKRVVDGHDRKWYCDRGTAVFDGEEWKEPRALIRVGLITAQTVEQAGIGSPDPDGQVALLA